jgi:hypothetical protein
MPLVLRNSWGKTGSLRRQWKAHILASPLGTENHADVDPYTNTHTHTGSQSHGQMGWDTYTATNTSTHTTTDWEVPHSNTNTRG